AGAANERAIDIRLCHQTTNVVGLDTPAIKNPACRRGLVAERSAYAIADTAVSIGGHFRSRYLARADCPAWFIGDYQLRKLLQCQACVTALKVRLQGLVRLFRLPLVQLFADAVNGRQTGVDRGGDFLACVLVGLAEILPPFAMCD